MKLPLRFFIEFFITRVKTQISAYKRIIFISLIRLFIVIRNIKCYSLWISCKL